MAIPLQQAIAEQQGPQDNSDKDIAGFLWVNRAELRELIEAAKMLRDDVANYVKINNLGDPFHNQDMRRIRAALQPFEDDK